jgi:hypothetical protein
MKKAFYFQTEGFFFMMKRICGYVLFSMILKLE